MRKPWQHRAQTQRARLTSSPVRERIVVSVIVVLERRILPQQLGQRSQFPHQTCRQIRTLNPSTEFPGSPKSNLAEMLQGQPGSDAAIRLQSQTAVSEIPTLSGISKINVECAHKGGMHNPADTMHQTLQRQHLQQENFDCVHLLMRLQPTGSLSLTVGLLCFRRRGDQPTKINQQLGLHTQMHRQKQLPRRIPQANGHTSVSVHPPCSRACTSATAQSRRGGHVSCKSTNT